MLNIYNSNITNTTTTNDNYKTNIIFIIFISAIIINYVLLLVYLHYVPI